eukprot:SAG22_NODE_227_length_14641_cov_11.007908_13_plen_76_part_00
MFNQAIHNNPGEGATRSVTIHGAHKPTGAIEHGLTDRGTFTDPGESPEAPALSARANGDREKRSEEVEPKTFVYA